MKIEKISDSQIRCTLSKDDLLDRELRLSELAYGTEKAKALFRDMMQQASYEFGFEADDIPLMIEAIPVSPECLVLVITKVEDPDELDTRFSKFSSGESESDSDDFMTSLYDDDDDENTDDILGSLNPVDDLSGDDTSTADLEEAADTPSKEKETDSAPQAVSVKANLYKVFSFHSLDEVIAMSSMLASLYRGENTLYKDSVDNIYYLTLYKSEHSKEDFIRICNMIAEYGRTEKSAYATEDYFKEHYETICKHNAIQILSVM